MATREAVAIFVVAFVAYALWKRRWAWIVAGGLAVAVVDPLCARVIKPLAGRDRPCREVEGVQTPHGCGAALAMPSIHAATTAAIAGATGLPVLAGVSLITGASRVVTGQHWPSDVLVGWIVGGAIGGAIGRGVGGATRAGMRAAMGRARRGRGRKSPPADAPVD